MVTRLLAAAALVAATASTSSAESISAGESLSLDLKPGETQQVALETPIGSYVEGQIEGSQFTADLLSADGGHFRNIADDDEGGAKFRFVAETAETPLQVSADGALTVKLEQVIPPSEMVPEAPEYLSPKIAELARSYGEGTDTAAFWDEVTKTGTPLVEPAKDGMNVITFLWRGAQSNVRLYGGPSSDHDWLERLGDSDVWFKSYLVPDTTRLAYQLAPDIPAIPGGPWVRRAALLSTSQSDPLNLHPWPADAPDRFNQKSTLTLANAPQQPGTPPAAEADPLLTRFEYPSELLGNVRTITLSHSRDFDVTDPYLVTLFLFDGVEAEQIMDTPRVLDSLTREGRLPPVLLVMIPSLGTETRAQELPGNDVFADALATELAPLIEQKTGVKLNPSRTAVAGASYGGLAAATVALHHPERFGNVISLSGSFWWAPKGDERDQGFPWLAMRYAAAEKLPLRFHLTAGRFETTRGENRGIRETSSILRDVLKLKGYEVGWQEYSAGHDYFVWRGALADALIALFPTAD